MPGRGGHGSSLEPVLRLRRLLNLNVISRCKRNQCYRSARSPSPRLSSLFATPVSWSSPVQSLMTVCLPSRRQPAAPIARMETTSASLFLARSTAKPIPAYAPLNQRMRRVWLPLFEFLAVESENLTSLPVTSSSPSVMQPAGGAFADPWMAERLITCPKDQRRTNRLLNQVNPSSQFQHERSFCGLKNAFKEECLLAQSKPSTPITVEMDASNDAIMNILSPLNKTLLTA